MAIPRMCDVCEKLARSDGRDDMRMQTNVPEGWFYLNVIDPDRAEEKDRTKYAEVCSSKCAVKFVKGATATDVTTGSGGSGNE